MANGDDEAMRAIQRKAQEALRRKEAEEAKQRDFNRRRQNQLADEQLIREASEAIKRAQRNPTPSNVRKADKARADAKRGSGGLCLPILILGAAALGVVATLISQAVRAFI